MRNKTTREQTTAISPAMTFGATLNSSISTCSRKVLPSGAAVVNEACAPAAELPAIVAPVEHDIL